METLFIEGRRDGYSVGQCSNTMTVGQLMEYLSNYNENAKVMLINDNGYTYGTIDEFSFLTRDDDDVVDEETDTDLTWVLDEELIGVDEDPDEDVPRETVRDLLYDLDEEERPHNLDQLNNLLIGLRLRTINIKEEI